MSEAQPYTDIRINVGCGKHVLEGWTNIDIAVSPLAKRAPEILCDIRKIPLPDGCAKELMAIHVFEHINRWESESTLCEWARLLKSGGSLVLEMPDIIKCCRNIITGLEGKKPEQLGMWGCYGDWTLKDERMMHAWGWTFATIKPLLVEAGFVEVNEERTQFHSIGRDVRDFRVTAKKA